MGNTINPSKVQEQPDVQFIDHVPSDSASSTRKLGKMQFTLALTDPDAPSRDNPEWSEVCHWIATDVQITDPTDDRKKVMPVGFSKDVKAVMPYKAPGPPPKTGKHRYVFVALAPKNGTTGALQLTKPDDRRHWGYGKERQGLRKWAEEMGLEVVGTYTSLRD